MPLISINLRLDKKELDAIDAVSTATPRTWWIRGAIQQRLGWNTPTPKDERSPAPQSNGHRDTCGCLNCERLRGNIRD